MRKANQRMSTDRKTRRAEWRLYAGDLKDFFGHTVYVGREAYRIEGWLVRNPIHQIYAIRERDDLPFIMSRGEVDTDTMTFHPPSKSRRVDSI